jgi:hypothetical protein
MEEAERVNGALARNDQFLAAVGTKNYRILEVSFPEAEGKARVRRRAAEPAFRATVYDYDGQRTLLVDGTVGEPSRWEFTELATQPAPTGEEFAQAVRMLGRDEAVGKGLQEGSLVATRPMPPVLTEDLEDGRTRRYIGVQILGDGGRRSVEILGVDPATGDVIRFPGGAPARSRSGNLSACGAPTGANQPTAPKGTPGQVSVTIKHRNRTIWQFVAVRPAASAGTNGSGIELRNVNYRNRRLLSRGHVPILNVKYDQDRCGPYRDWQYEEGRIQAVGTDVGSTGFRLCPQPATTIVETGSDSGNFLGVGVYITGSEVVFVSEMEAGWYRYISQWRFDVNGVLRPRFAFAAVENSCVCNVHYHHVYWRLDFDIIDGRRNRVEEFNDPPLSGTSNWSTVRFETRRARNPAKKRRWKVTNPDNGAAVQIRPGADDSLAGEMPDAPFGQGDVWLLKYRPNQVDDGVVAIGPPYEAGIQQWVNGERIDAADVVIWYAGHFAHDLSHDAAALHGHILGPDITIHDWPNATS